MRQAAKFANFIVISGAAALAAQPADAALSISTTAVEPTANVEFSFTSDGRNDKGRIKWDTSGSGVHDVRGGTWTTGASGYTLDQIVLKQGNRDTGAFDTAGLSMYMDILEVADVNNNGDPGANTVTFSSVLTTGAAAYPAGNNGDFIVFDVDDVALDPNRVYAYRIGWASGNNDTREVQFLGGGGGSGLDDITVVNWSGDTINSLQNTTTSGVGDSLTQFMLTTYVVSVIPEPGTLALASLGGLMIFARRRSTR